MSSRRSRRAGSRTSTVLSRYIRSSRKRFSRVSEVTSALVAEMSRTSTLTVRELPTRFSSPVSRTRRSFACWVSGMLAISSRNRLPPSASSKAPMRSCFASVKAPLTWPNISLSKTPSERPPALMHKSGRPARGEMACSRRATTSLPVPCSPVMSTFASLGPARAISSGASSLRSRLSSSRRRLRRSARPSSTCVRRVASSRALSKGFST